VKVILDLVGGEDGLYDKCAGCGQVPARQCRVAASVVGLAEVPVPFCTFNCLAAYVTKWDAVNGRAATPLYVEVDEPLSPAFRAYRRERHRG